MSSYAAEIESSVRPKLNLQPRTSAADLATGASYCNKPSPFGAARPREQVIAEREGKKEVDVFKEQAEKEWRGNITLSEAQREEKRAAEAELVSARRELDAEVDPVKLKSLKEDVVLKQRNLENLLNSFERLAVHTAQSGGIRRSHDKKLRSEISVEDGFISFTSKARSNHDGWNHSGGRGRSNQSQCFSCGEIGHFSRDCPNSNYARGRPCFTCGQEGHYSRECPLLLTGGAYGMASYTLPEFSYDYSSSSSSRTGLRGCYNPGATY